MPTGIYDHSRGKWTKKEIKILKENFENIDTKSLSELLFRSKIAIKIKSHNLNLHLPSRCVKKKCNYCGKVFVSFVSEHRKYCSKKCYDISIKGHPNYAPPPTKEARKLQSIKMKKRYRNDKEFRKRLLKRLKENPPHLNKKHSKETIEKIKEIRSHQVIPTKDTLIEVAVQNELKKRNIKFRTHHPILGQPDIFIEPNICIFVDGCYWHGCKKCYDKNKLNKTQRKNMINDQLVTQKLENDGYIVLRFCGHEIKENLNNIVNIINRIINNRSANRY